MTRLRRLLSTLLAAVLLLNMIPPARAAEGDPGQLTMTVSDASAIHGDTLTVTIAASQSFETSGSGMTVCYDPEVLEPVPESSSAANPFRISTPLMVQGKTVLRISFFPGETVHTFAADQALAVLTFRTRKPADNTTLEMTGAYLYDGSREIINVQKAEPVSVAVTPIDVTGIALDMTTLNLEIGTSQVLKAIVMPENASDKAVTWTSSDETKVSVADGKLTGLALTEEPVTITAAAAGFTAACTVNVVLPPDAGYAVTMPSDSTVVVGENIAVAPVIGNSEGVSIYNAYDITFTYDPSMLLLTTTQLEDSTVTVTDGKVNILRYGSDLSIGSAPFTLIFKTLKTGDARITLAEARIDHSENAIIRNAAKAYCRYETVKVTVQGYRVNLPSDFNGAAVAEPGGDYTFEARNKLYDYTFNGSTMNGQTVAVRDNGNGTYTVENVTGPLDINIEGQKTGKTFNATLGTDMTAESSTAQYMTDYTATLHEDDNYTYTVRVTIGGAYYSGFTKSGNTYTIPGLDIAGDIVFTVIKTPVSTPSTPTIYHKVTFEGSGAGAAEGNATSVAEGSRYSFTLNKEEGYLYAVTYQMGTTAAAALWPDADGKYTISNVTGALVITVEREQEQPHDRVEVTEYVTLKNGRTMYLVLVHETLDSGSIYTYAEEPMYYSQVYNAWCILTPEEAVLTREIAETRISEQSGEMTAIGFAAYDVNMTGAVDINDAQLTYDLYNGKYNDFSVINMHKFLNADINADRKINVTDAAAVAAAIK